MYFQYTWKNPISRPKPLFKKYVINPTLLNKLSCYNKAL